MNSLTNEQKLFLAKQLPEQIVVELMPDKTTEMFWNDTKLDVTDREWHYIVAEVENQIPEESQTRYCTILGEYGPNMVCYDFQSHRMDNLDVRIAALRQVLGEKI